MAEQWTIWVDDEGRAIGVGIDGPDDAPYAEGVIVCRAAEAEGATMTDEQTTTVHLDNRVADELLDRAGFQRDARGEYVRPDGAPYSEGGRFGTDWYWERDEALTQALVILAGGDE